MDYVNTAKQIDNEGGVYMWNGAPEDVQEVRNGLWDHWERCDGKPVTGGCPTNMHEDTRCVDRRFLTTDPDNWEAPKKRKVN
jgi:hypothetical protein